MYDIMISSVNIIISSNFAMLIINEIKLLKKELLIATSRIKIKASIKLYNNNVAFNQK